MVCLSTILSWVILARQFVLGCSSIVVHTKHDAFNRHPVGNYTLWAIKIVSGIFFVFIFSKAFGKSQFLTYIQQLFCCFIEWWTVNEVGIKSINYCWNVKVHLYCFTITTCVHNVHTQHVFKLVMGNSAEKKTIRFDLIQCCKRVASIQLNSVHCKQETNTKSQTSC